MSDIKLIDAADSLGRELAPLLAFADQAIADLRAEWTDETRVLVLQRAMRSVIEDHACKTPSLTDTGLIQEYLIESLAECVRLQSLLISSRVASVDQTV